MKSAGLSQLARRTQEPPISWLMKLALDRPRLISLAAGFTDGDTLPVRETLELTRELLAAPKPDRAALQYGSTAGDPRLRELTVQRVAALDGAADDSAFAPDRAIITHGSQQLLYLVTECLCDPGDIVLVEDPTYFVFLGMIQSRGLECRGIPMEADGLSLPALERTLEALQRSGQLSRVKLLYTVSYFQNPSGVTTSLEKKAGVLEILRQRERAAGHPIYLLEDAAYREMRFAGEDVPSALSISRFANRVIYTGTYSKPFATGIRAGFGLLPEPLGTAVRRVKGNHDFGTANYLQQLLARALISGKYERRLGPLRTRYAHKARVMADSVRAHFPAGIQWEEPRGGLYLWPKLPIGIKSGMKSRLFQTALERDVLYVPGELCYGDDPTRRKPNRELRLSFGSASEAEIRTGIERLGAVLRELL